jgi:hypothetical protein
LSNCRDKNASAEVKKSIEAAKIPAKREKPNNSVGIQDVDIASCVHHLLIVTSNVSAPPVKKQKLESISDTKSKTQEIDEKDSE